MTISLLIAILGTTGTIYFTYTDYKAQKATKEHFNKIAVLCAITLGFEIFLLLSELSTPRS